MRPPQLRRSTLAQSSPVSRPYLRLILWVALFFFLFHAAQIRGQAPPSPGYLYQERLIETAPLGIAEPADLAFLPPYQSLLVVDGSGAGAAFLLQPQAEAATRAAGLNTAASTPAAVAFDAYSRSLFLLHPRERRLIQIPLGPQGELQRARARVTAFDPRHLGLARPIDMTFDPATGRLFLLDGADPGIAVVTPDPVRGFDGSAAARSGRVETMPLTSLAAAQITGIAFDPASSHLFLADPSAGALYEVRQDGTPVAVRDLSGLSPAGLVPMTFAPSGDPTDDPSEMSLYIAEPQAGRLVELSLHRPLTANLPVPIVPTYRQRFPTFDWDPPSPDPMGIAYHPGLGDLLISDSEVVEMAIFAGVNVFQATETGSLVATCDTLAFSNEPAGLAVNPDNGHLFFADDDKNSVFEVSFGPDGEYCTGDDAVTSFSSESFDSFDPAGAAYGDGFLFVADRAAKEIYRIAPGANGIFDGKAPAGDDQVTHFDTETFGLRHPDGLGYHPDRGTLFITSRTEDLLVETTPDGTVLVVYDLAAFPIYAPSGVGFGPASHDPALTSVYITDRGVDNNVNPDENDGWVYEFDVGTIPPRPSALYLPLLASASK